MVSKQTGGRVLRRRSDTHTPLGYHRHVLFGQTHPSQRLRTHVDHACIRGDSLLSTDEHRGWTSECITILLFFPPRYQTASRSQKWKEKEKEKERKWQREIKTSRWQKNTFSQGFAAGFSTLSGYIYRYIYNEGRCSINVLHNWKYHWLLAMKHKKLVISLGDSKIRP